LIQLTWREQILNIVNMKSIDNIGLFGHFLTDNIRKLSKIKQFHVNKNLRKKNYFAIATCFEFNIIAALNFVSEIIKECKLVIMHSYDYIEPLINENIETGIDYLHVIGIKADMDLLKKYKQSGSKSCQSKGRDAGNIAGNNLNAIGKKLWGEIPVEKEEGLNIHLIPHTCNYKTYKFL